MRVAYLSPLPPQRSGIADYSAELVPHLAKLVDLTLFTDHPRDSRQALGTERPVADVGGFLARADSFDMTIYHLGNNPEYHGSIYRAALRHPGVVMLHEYMLHHLVQGLTVARGDPRPYVEEMRYCYGTTGERLARRYVETGLPIDTWRYPLFERVVDRSLGLLVHNRSTRDRVLASRPGTMIEVVPHHLSLERLPKGGGAEIRARFDIAEDAFLVASFGFMTPQKRLEVALNAFAELHRRLPRSRYLLAGEVSPYYDLGSLLDGRLGDGVIVTGRLELEDLLAAMRACDVAVNLRYPSAGETSGTLMRLLGLGKPVIVSNHGSLAEVPAGCCAKLDLDELETALLVEYLLELERRPDLGRRMGVNARRHMEREHTLAGSATAYAAFLERVRKADREPFRAAPPLSRGETQQVFGALVREIGTAAADLGVRDTDSEPLAELAAMLADLNLDSTGVAGQGPR